MFALYMNPVTANAERYIPVAIADTEARLTQLLKDESCDGYNDGTFFRRFREGLLHNYNPPEMNGQNVFGACEGIVEVVGQDDLEQKHREELQAWSQHFSNAAWV